MSYIPTSGDIIILNRKGKLSSWFSSAQRFFTKQNFTHTAILLGEIENTFSVISADEVVCCVPLSQYLAEDSDMYIFKVNFPDDLKQSACKQIYDSYAGQPFGYLQDAFYFPYRWFMEVFFKKDVRKKDNFFKQGITCSELSFRYLTILAEENPELKSELDNFLPDNVHVGDIWSILINHNDLFTLAYSKFPNIYH